MPDPTRTLTPTCIDVIVDTQSLLADYPTPSLDAQHPTPVANAYCYMIGPPARTRGQATAHLYIGAEQDGGSEDTGRRPQPVHALLQWRCFSLSGNADQSAILYSIEPIRKKQARTRAKALEVYKPAPILVDANNTAPPTFSSSLQPDYFMETVLEHRGSTRFDIRFYVTQNDPQTSQLHTIGYFSWASEVSIRL